MSAVDDFEELLDALLEAGVFEPSEDGELRPTQAFHREREERRAEIAAMDDEAFDDAVDRFATDDDVAASDVDADTLGAAMAIHDSSEALDRERSLLAALALGRLEETEREPGVPRGFVRIESGDVDGFVGNHPAAVIYVWREDCDPCDGARENFESLLADGEIPEWVGLGAVYGPDAADLIREEYQVGVAPTTLFCVDGAIDSRIVGNPGYEAFRSEIRTITEAAE